MADDAGSPDFRYVRCPRCRKVLKETPQIPVYICGGCNATLQARPWNDTDKNRADKSAGVFVSSSARPAPPDHVDLPERNGISRNPIHDQVSAGSSTGEEKQEPISTSPSRCVPVVAEDQRRRLPTPGMDADENQPHSDSGSSGAGSTTSRLASSLTADDQLHEPSHQSGEVPHQPPSTDDDETVGGDMGATDYEADVDNSCQLDRFGRPVAAAARPLPLPPARRVPGGSISRNLPRPSSFDSSTSSVSNGTVAKRVAAEAARADWVLYEEVRTSFQERTQRRASSETEVIREVDQVRVRVLRPSSQHALPPPSPVGRIGWRGDDHASDVDARAHNHHYNYTPSPDHQGQRYSWDRQLLLQRAPTPGRAESPRVSKRHCRPIMGAAAFVLCYECDELLQLPQSLQFSRRRSPSARVRCGACSEVLAFSIGNRNRIVPFTGMSAGATVYSAEAANPTAFSRNGTGRPQRSDQVSVSVSDQDDSDSTDHGSPVGPVAVPTGKPLPTLHQLMGYCSATDMLSG